MFVQNSGSLPFMICDPPIEVLQPQWPIAQQDLYSNIKEYTFYIFNQPFATS